ncbi:MAG: MerR family DNA-binding protein [Desulfobacterales bacterium]
MTEEEKKTMYCLPFQNWLMSWISAPGRFALAEEKSLILPKRTKGNHRVYDKRDRARLKLILRGKRLGYSLEEIAEMIGLANFNKGRSPAAEKTFAYGKKSCSKLD